MVKRLISFLSGMPLGLFLFFMSAFLSILGTLRPSVFPDYQRSPIFTATLAVMVLNTGLCTLRRTRGLRRWSLWVVHASVVVIALGGLGSALLSRTVTVELGIGDSYAIPEAFTGGRRLAVRLIDFQTDLYPDGSPAEWRSILGMRVDGGEEAVRILRVNHPVSHGAVSLLQASHGTAYHLSIRESGLPVRRIPAESGIPTPLAAGGGVGILFETPAGVLPAGTPIRYQAILGSSVAGYGATELGKAVRVDENLEFTVEKAAYRSGLSLRYDPALGVVWLGFALMGLAVCGLVMGKERAE